MAETPRAGRGDFACRSWRYRCSTMLNRLGNLFIVGTLISSLPPPDNRGWLPPHAQCRILCRLLASFSNRWVHLDTVSRQIFGNIQETQFSGSEMEVHVYLKNAFPGGIGNRWITFGYNLWLAKKKVYLHESQGKKLFRIPKNRSKMSVDSVYRCFRGLQRRGG